MSPLVCSLNYPCIETHCLWDAVSKIIKNNKNIFMCVFYCGLNDIKWDLSSKQIFSVLYNILSYKHNAAQQVSRTFSSCTKEAIYPLNSDSP